MKISKLKINGVTDPVGFDLSKIVCSWIVSESASDYAENVQIDVSLSKDFKKILYRKKGKHLCSAGELLQMPLTPRTTYYWRVQVKGNKGDSGVSEPAIFETGKMKELWKAKWIGPEPSDKFHPVLNYTFDVENEQNLRRARLYICGVGLYEAWLNGERIGREYLTPYLNDYQTGLQYQTYDVKETLKERNKIEILLGNGWYKGHYGSGKENFGNQFAAIAELILEYEDGSSKSVITDRTWKYSGADIEASDIYDGEIYNHMLWKDKENSQKPAVEVKIPYSLRERYSLPVLAKEIRNVQEILYTPAGETVLDFGQNMTGYVSFQTPQGMEKGTRIELDFGEILQDGNFYRDNYRTAKSRFVYVSDGRKETVHPHFTFFGFRYVRVCGWCGELKKEDFCGNVVYSDLEQTGWIETSNPKVNRLFLNSIWGQKDNFLDIPTDCPQRDERLGWTGDICVFAPTAGYHMDTRAFLAKFLKDLHADQLRRDGITANTFPDVLEMGGAGSVWGDAATLIPSTQYQQFGDIYELAESYPMMKDWVDSITRRDVARGEKYRFDFGFHFGDWLSMDGASAQSQKGGTEDGYIGTVYYYATTCAVAEAAKILKRKEDFKYYTVLAKHIKKVWPSECACIQVKNKLFFITLNIV